ncbi:MAG: YceI family protein [Planctomycetota bacterium]
MNRRFATLVAALVLVAGLLHGLFSPTAEAQGSPETYQVDPVHSSVVFRVKHMGVSYLWGRFNDVSGRFTLRGGDPTSVEVTVQAQSVDTHSAKRDQHLRSPDFFSAKQYPLITFKGTRFTKAGDGRYEVAGDLSVHGVTKQIAVTVEHTGTGPGMGGKGTLAGFEATFDLQRSDFGMTKLRGPVGDDVRVIVSLEGGLR